MSLAEDEKEEREEGNAVFAEYLYNLFDEAGMKDGLQVTLSDGRIFTAEPHYQGWKSFVHPDLLEFDENEFTYRCLQLGLNPESVFFFYVKSPETQNMLSLEIMYTDPTTVSVVRKIEADHDWDLGHPQVMPPELVEAIKTTLRSHIRDQERFLSTLIEPEPEEE